MNAYIESGVCYDKAKAIPGRSSTRSKAPGRLMPVGTGPLYAESGEGCYLRDVDGNQYIDMLCALGAISLGYGIGVTPIAGAVRNGWVLSLPSRLEGETAEKVLSSVTQWASSVRFLKTGSEATHAALLMAQLATGRKSYLRLVGSYHGWHTIWREDAPDAVWFDVGDSVCKAANGRQVAAVIIEPPRWQSYSPEWLQSVVDEAHGIGALVIFDEMIYGGRWHIGGASELHGIHPDMACFGKAIGNGAPIALVAGNDVVRLHGEQISGTYSGDAAALAAVKQTLAFYKSWNVVDHLWTIGAQLQIGLDEIASDSNGLAVREGRPVHQRLRFLDAQHGRLFSAGMAARGVLWHPDCINVMASHTVGIIESVLMAARDVMRELTRDTQ